MHWPINKNQAYIKNTHYHENVYYTGVFVLTLLRLGKKISQQFFTDKNGNSNIIYELSNLTDSLLQLSKNEI